MDIKKTDLEQTLQDEITNGSGSVNTFNPTTLAHLEDVANVDKIAIITTVIDLGAATLDLQKGMPLVFSGGSFTNGTINWNYNPIQNKGLAKIFDETNLSHTGSAFAQDILIEWFGAVADGVTYINSKAGNDTVNTFGVTPFDRANEFMNTCKGGTLVFSDKTANYYVNVQDPDDGEPAATQVSGLFYTASNTQIRIDKGARLHANPCDHNWFSLLGLKNVINVKVYGGGAIRGNFDTHTGDWENVPIDNGTGIYTWFNCENITIDDIEIYDFTGDGIAQRISSNGYMASIPTTHTYELGNIDASGNDIASTENTRTGLITFAGNDDHDRLGWTRIVQGPYGRYSGTEGKAQVYFYDVSGVFIEAKYNVWMYERLYFPTGATQLRIVFNKDSLQYTDALGVVKDDEFRLQPTEMTEGMLITNCDIHNVSRNGISGTGATNVTIRDNFFHDQGISTEGRVMQTLLRSGIDIEDFYNGNRGWIIDSNTFQDNPTGGIAMIKAHNVTISNNTFLESKYGDTSVSYQTNGNDVNVFGNKIYGGSAYMNNHDEALQFTTNKYHDNLYYNAVVVATGGHIYNEQFINCEFRYSGQLPIIAENLLFKNNANKTSELTPAYTLYGTNHANGRKVILRNVTIEGESPIRNLNMAANNTYIENLTMTGGGSTDVIYAHQIDGFKTDGWINLYATTGNETKNVFKRIESDRVWVKAIGTDDITFDDCLISLPDVSNTKNNIDVSVNLSKLSVKNSELTSTVTSSTDSKFIDVNATQLGTFVFENNIVTAVTNQSTTTFNVGTPTNPSIVRGNTFNNAEPNTLAVDLVRNNTIDGKVISIYPVYADNAAAIIGGLEAGEEYITATGDKKVVY